MKVINTTLIVKLLPGDQDENLGNKFFLIDTATKKFVMDIANETDWSTIPVIHKDAKDSWNLQEYAYVKWGTDSYVIDTTKNDDNSNAEYVYKVSPHEIAAEIDSNGHVINVKLYAGNTANGVKWSDSSLTTLYSKNG